MDATTAFHFADWPLPRVMRFARLQVPLESGVALTIPDTAVPLQNWTFVANGSGLALFRAGVAEGLGDMYAASRAGCPEALPYQPLAQPLAPLAPGKYLVCGRSAATGPRAIGFLYVTGPVSFRTVPGIVEAGTPFLMVFDGVQLDPGDAWGPSASGVCNGTRQPLSVRGNEPHSAMESARLVLGSGQYTVCYYTGQTAVVLNGTLAVSEPGLTGVAAVLGTARSVLCTVVSALSWGPFNHAELWRGGAACGAHGAYKRQQRPVAGETFAIAEQNIAIL